MPETEEVRCRLNGCFDFIHLGHLNALRQVKQYRELLRDQKQIKVI